MSTSKPRRMDGYIRVSRKMGREGPGYISPTVQREAIQRWADYRHIEIIEWHEDEDESGGTQNRPGLREAIRRVEAHETDGIACWRLNRFARNVAAAIGDVERVHAAGGHLAFVEEDIDPTGPFGSFILTILLAVATLERDNLVQGWKTAKSRAMDRGVTIGPTAFGFRRGDDSCLEPDPVYGPIVAEAFQRAARDGIGAALAYLVEHGNGRTWTASTVRRMLTKRSYLGEARYGDLVNLQAHAPLVSRAVWEAAQQEPAERRRPKATFPLSGLATCAACGNALVGARGGNHAQRMYRCSAALKTYKGERCVSPTTVTAQLLEDLVRAATIEALSGHRGFSGTDDAEGSLEDAEGALRDRELDLDDLLNDAELRRTLGPARFRRLAETTVGAVDAARDTYRDAARHAEQRMRVPSVEIIEDADLEELGDLLRGVLQNIVVTRGRTPLAGRVRIVPKGLPADLRVAAG
ncbi:MAG: recombinase family protein [Solirubrobacteraceae bacterium]